MKTKSFFLLLITIITSGCSFIQSSFEYTRGTQCLERQDYNAAVVHLENAVRLNPKLSKNHNNLAVAYLETKNFEKAWYHSRQAVLIDGNNYEAIFTFKELSRAIFKRCDIKEGMGFDEVVIHLGKPDHVYNTANETVYFYGTIGIGFIDEKINHILGVSK